VDTVEAVLSEELSSTFAMRVGSLLTRRALRHFRRRLDYSEYGGAPLLAWLASAIVGHGRSSALAVRNAVAMPTASPPIGSANVSSGDRARRYPSVIAFIFPDKGRRRSYG